MREEQALAAGALPGDITDQDVLDYLLTALTPWLER
jgi:hypothetical protein